MSPRLHDFAALGPHGFTRVAYAEWGPAEAARTVLCVHGLTRNGRDFDPLAEALADEGVRVVAPDIPGRGRSAWLTHPADYGYPFYVGAMASLIARLRVERLDWVGTSMGGLIGMMLAAQRDTPIRRLVLNDIGAFIPKASLVRIGTYVGDEPLFDGLEAAEEYLRRRQAGFGRLSDAQWQHLARHNVRPGPDGKLRLHYDPAIAAAFTAKEPDDVALWPIWDLVACPTLILRGAQSDLLLPQTVAEMKSRGAAGTAGKVETAEIAECGHAPALMARDQIALVARFLGA
jgi:pimeloyl-ACP methyl ester carboxylesterase